MWAAVLVPMWLRRHETATETRSVDRFSTAMRILSRRPVEAAGSRAVLMPRRVAAMSYHVSGASAPREREQRRRAPSRSSSARAQLVARRRRTLLGLLGLVLASMVIALATGAWWFQLVADVLLVAFVVHLRRVARATAAVRRRRTVPAPRPARRTEPVFPAAVSGAPAEPAVPVAGDEPVADAPAAETTGTDGWAPVPVPPPTYALKPHVPGARSAAEMVDLTRPGAWSEAQQLEHELLERPQAQAEEWPVEDWAEDWADDDLDAIVDRRRAVGED